MRISKKYRVTAAAVLAASSVVTVAPGLSHANSMYKDVSPSASYYKDLVELVNQGVISGYADKTFKPDAAVTRGHFAQMLAQLLKLDISKVNDPYLSDVTSSNPFYKYIAALAGVGVDLSYEDGSFKPNQAITRLEAAQMLADTLDLKPTSGGANYNDVPMKHKVAVKAVVQNGLMKAPSSRMFNANGTITRAESISLLSGIQAFQQDEGTFTFNSLTSAGQVSTSEGTYRLSAEMKKIFNASNAAALSGAQIKAVISNKQIIKVTGITFNQSGSTYGAVTFNADGAKIEGNVFINADYLRLQNVKINGNVTVNDEASYNVTFDKVSVKQSVVIEDGYSSSFTFAANNSTIPQLYVKRDNTLVNTDQKITAIVIEGDADDVALNVRVGKVTIAAGMYPTITGYATIEEMIVERSADVDLRVNGTLAKLDIVHGDSTVYSNRNLLISDVLIPRGSEYTDIIANYSIVAGYIMSVKRPDSNGNLLGIGKVPNIPDGVLHPGAGGGGDGSNTGISFDRAVARAVSSFGAVSNGKSVTLTTRFNSLDSITKTALGEALYDYRIKSRSTLPATAKYTFEIRNGANTYTATVTGKQLNDGIKLEYLILKALGQVTNMSGATNTWTISVETLNGTLDLKVDLLIKDKVAKSAVFGLTGTDINAGEDGVDKPDTGDDGTDPGDGDKPGDDKNPVTGPGEETEEEAKPIAELLESYSVSGNAATLNISTRFKEMGETFKQAHGNKTYDYKVKATNLSGVSPNKEFTIVVKNGSKTSEGEKVTADKLTKGIYISSFFSEKKLGNLSSLSNNTDTSSIQFVGLDTVVDLKVDLLAEDAVVRSMNEKVAGSYENAVKEAVKFNVGTSTNQVTIKADYGTILKELLQEAKINPNLKITSVYEGLTDRDKLNISFYIGNDEIVTNDFLVSQLKSGISLNDYYGFDKLANAMKGNSEQMQIVFNNLEGELKAEVQGIVTNNDKPNVTISTHPNLTITKSDDVFLKEQARGAVEKLEIPRETFDPTTNIGDGKGSVSDNILKFTTHFTEHSKDIGDDSAVVDYKIKVSSSSIVKPQENTVFNLVVKHNGTLISGVTATGKELIAGFLLGDKVGKDKLVKYANMRPAEWETEIPKDDWSIEIAELNIMTTLDIELFANNVSLHDATKDTSPKYKKSLTLKQTAIEETLINQLINEFKVTKVEDNKVTIEASFESNVLEETADIMVSADDNAFLTLKTREISSQKPVSIKITDVNDKSKFKQVTDLTVKDFSISNNNPVNLGLQQLTPEESLIHFNGGEYTITIEFDDIYSEQKMNFSLKVGDKVYRTLPDVTINAKNTLPIYSELDMAIRGFTAEVDNSKYPDILEVETKFGPAVVPANDGTQVYVNKDNLGNANLDARITLPESWNEAPDNYIVKDLEIELNEALVPTVKKEVTIEQLKKGVLLSTLVGGKGKLEEHLEAGRVDNWQIKAHEFVFAANMDVELLLTDIKAANIPNQLTIRKVPVTFTDRNTWTNYNDDIVVSTENLDNGAAKVSFKFAHKLPKEFYKETSYNTEGEYKKKVLNMLFDSWNDSNISDYSKVKIIRKTNSEIENELEVVFEAGALKEEVGATSLTSTSLGYKAYDLELKDGKTFKKKLDDSSELEYVYLVFEKDLLPVKEDEKDYYPFSTRFVEQSEYKKIIEEYRTRINGFDVTFSNNVGLDGIASTEIKNLLTVVSEFGTAALTSDGNKLVDAQLKTEGATANASYEVEVYVNGTKIDIPNKSKATILGSKLNSGIKLSEVIKDIKSSTGEVRGPLSTHENRTDTWQLVITSPSNQTVTATVDLLLITPVAGSTQESTEVVSTRKVKMDLNQ